MGGISRDQAMSVCQCRGGNHDIHVAGRPTEATQPEAANSANSQAARSSNARISRPASTRCTLLDYALGIGFQFDAGSSSATLN